MELNEFKVGDLLLFKDKGWNEGVAWGQGAERGVWSVFSLGGIWCTTRKGSIYTHHAALIAISGASPIIAHCAGEKAELVQLVSQFYRGTPYGKVVAYRLRGEDLEAYAPAAGQVAFFWGDHAKIQYGGALKPGRGLSYFKKGAKRRAKVLSDEWLTVYTRSREEWLDYWREHLRILIDIEHSREREVKLDVSGMKNELGEICKRCELGINPRGLASSYSKFAQLLQDHIMLVGKHKRIMEDKMKSVQERRTLETFFGMKLGTFGDIVPMEDLLAQLNDLQRRQLWSPQNSTKMFCSYFAIAAYQTVMGVDAKNLLALDASKTSPMRLEHYLKTSDKWELAGEYEP